MEAFFTQEILSGLSNGDVKKVIAYAAIFFIIWLEVRGLKKEFKKLNESIATSFKAGEDRFNQIEERLHKLETTPHF